ncbi:MAG: AbiEi antitoxin N-terminal domain-containing protein [Mangrovibacterium sp.]
MSTKNEIKIKNLLELHVPNTVLLSSWLNAKGYSYELQKRYKASGVVGIYRYGGHSNGHRKKITWEGGLYAVQNQTELHVHIGGAYSFILTWRFTLYTDRETDNLPLFSAGNQITLMVLCL